MALHRRRGAAHRGAHSGLGREVNGARRWLPLGVINLQPSELMKLFAALYAADYTVRKLPFMSSFRRGFLPMAAVILSVGFLLIKEPDFGAFVVITAIAFGILFLGGINVRLFALLAVVAALGFILLITFSDYRRQRILGFMDPWQDAFGKGLPALACADRLRSWRVVRRRSGRERGSSSARSPPDFLLAVIAEELGFVGVLAVVALFALIVQRAFVIGRQAISLERFYSGLVAQGLGLWIGVQSFINMGVNMGLLPTKGAHPSTDEFRRFGHRRQLHRARDPATYRLGESPG